MSGNPPEGRIGPSGGLDGGLPPSMACERGAKKMQILVAGAPIGQKIRGQAKSWISSWSGSLHQPGPASVGQDRPTPGLAAHRPSAVGAECRLSPPGPVGRPHSPTLADHEGHQPESGLKGPQKSIHGGSCLPWPLGHYVLYIDGHAGRGQLAPGPHGLLHCGQAKPSPSIVPCIGQRHPTRGPPSMACHEHDVHVITLSW